MLLSSHIPSEVERLATRVTIIRAGRAVGTGTLEEMQHDGRTEQVLATATSRTRALLATLVVGILGATWLLPVTGVMRYRLRDIG